MKHRSVIEACMEKGWDPTRIKGGHLIMTKENKRSVPIPIHGKGLRFSIILKQLDQLPSKPKERKEANTPIESQSLLPSKSHPIKTATEPEGQEFLLTPEEAVAHKELEKLNHELLIKKGVDCYFAKNWKLGAATFNRLFDTYGVTTFSMFNVHVFMHMWGSCLYFHCLESLPHHSVPYVWGMLKAYDLFYGTYHETLAKVTDPKIKQDCKQKVEAILDDFTQEFNSKGLDISLLAQMSSKKLEAVFKSVKLLVDDTPNLSEEMLQKLVIQGFSVSFLLAHSDDDYTMYYEKALEFITLIGQRSEDPQFGYELQTAVHILAIAVRQDYIDKRLGKSAFRKLKFVNKLMELAQMVPITDFSLDNINFKLKELIPKMDVDGEISDAEKLMEEFKKIEEELDNPKYLSTKIGVYSYVTSKYVLLSNQITLRQGTRLAYLQAMLKSREIFTEILPDILKLQKIADPNDKNIKVITPAQVKFNTQQMILTTQKIYAVTITTKFVT